MKPYYEDDTVTLHLGDCRDVLPALDVRADLVVADPPYEETPLGWDRWPAGWLNTVAEVADAMWCFLPLRQFASPPFRGQEFHAAGWRLSHDVEPDLEAEHDHLTWEKHNGSSFAADRFRRVHEPVSHWYRGKWSAVHHEVPRTPGQARPSATINARQAGVHLGAIKAGGYEYGDTRMARSVLRIRSAHGRAIHPTEKPVELIDYLIRYGCPPGGTVIDPFAGSASTGVAARAAGMKAILVEGDEQICEKAAARLAAPEQMDLTDVKPIGGTHV